MGRIVRVARLPEHDAVSSEVRSWYTASTPAIGLSVLQTGYGFLTDSDRAEHKRLVLTEESPQTVAPSLEAAAEYYGSSAFEVWVDDRARADRLTPALTSAGLEAVQDTIVLALVGPVRASPWLHGLSVEDVFDPEPLREWATIKIQGFGDTEARPAPELLATEVAARTAEWPVCRYQLARLGGEGVAILGHYTGLDQMVFNLATRPPFRHRGIAQSMLARWSEEGDQQSVRSRLIDCDDGGPADALYRRLGFTDEVYWYRRYLRSAPEKVHTSTT
jgi:GNAT superfamily N-acetyltransferase